MNVECRDESMNMSVISQRSDFETANNNNYNTSRLNSKLSNYKKNQIEISNDSKNAKFKDNLNSYNKKYQYNLKESQNSKNKDKEIINLSYQSSLYQSKEKDQIKNSKNVSTIVNPANKLIKEELSFCSNKSLASQEYKRKNLNSNKINHDFTYLDNTYIKNILSKHFPDHKKLKEEISKTKKTINNERSAAKIKENQVTSRLNNKHLLKAFKLNQANKDNQNNELNKESLKMENNSKFEDSIHDSKCSKTPNKKNVRTVKESSKSSKLKFSPINYKSQFILEEKYKKLKSDYDKLKGENILNKKLNKEISKKLIKAQKKESLYDNIVSNFKEAEQAIIKLESNYLQCEIIRKEQAKLIKSLQKELENFKKEKDYTKDYSLKN